MQDDVKAVEMELRAIVTCGCDEDRAAETGRRAADTLVTLQERYERLEAAARAALPLVVGEEEASALELALTPHPDARSNEQ